jgi:hypothetical protein
MLLIVPFLAAAGCTTDDLETFAYGLNQTAYELDAQMNAPCPAGMFRQHVSETLTISYPRYSYEQIGYQVNPLGGGYSYCTVPVYYTHHDDDHRGHGGDQHDEEYSDGYRDGYRDGRRDN